MTHTAEFTAYNIRAILTALLSFRSLNMLPDGTGYTTTERLYGSGLQPQDIRALSDERALSILQGLIRRQKIQCIKAARTAFPGMGLKDAKEYVELIERQTAFPAFTRTSTVQVDIVSARREEPGWIVTVKMSHGTHEFYTETTPDLAAGVQVQVTL